MLRIDRNYSVDIRREPDGSCVYELLDEADNVVYEREAGTAYSSSEESLRALGKSMIEAHHERELESASAAPTRELIITVRNGVADIQALNLVLNAVQMRKSRKKPPMTYTADFIDGRKGNVVVLRDSEKKTRIAVWIDAAPPKAKKARAGSKKK